MISLMYKFLLRGTALRILLFQWNQLEKRNIFHFLHNKNGEFENLERRRSLYCSNTHSYTHSNRHLSQVCTIALLSKCIRVI